MKEMKKYLVLTAVLLVCAVLACGCTGNDNPASRASVGELHAVLILAEDRLNSINWNAEHPANIRAQLLASETDFKTVFDALSAKSPSSSDESYQIYTLRTIACSYIDMIAAMMDFANVIEQNNNAEYYANLYEPQNWKTYTLNADDALASARNNLYSAEYRMSGINMNMVPLTLQGEVTAVKVKISEFGKLMSSIAEEYQTAISAMT